MDLTFGELSETPIGPISFCAGEKGLQRISFSPLQELKRNKRVQSEKPSLDGLMVVGDLLSELNEFLFGIRRSFTIKIDWDVLGEYQRKVLEITSQIPYGDNLTYGEIAKKLGNPKASRAVGNALGSNPMPIVIPCHRVIGVDGALHGYSGGLQNKTFLLELEGHIIENGKLLRSTRRKRGSDNDLV